MSIVKFEVSYNTTTGEFSITNTDTGEVKTSNSKTTKKTSSKTVRKEENSIPTLTLEDNKYCLNQAAAYLMEVEAGDKLDIKYEKQGSTIIPVIGKDEDFGTKQGNKLTKSLTVACRGSKNNELAKYGNVFTIKQHSSKEGIFILINDSIEQVDEKEEEELSLPIDEDLQSIIDDEDAEITEIPSSMFQL